jgi:hypothetical protein
VPRYLIERSFPDGFEPAERDADEGVTWLHSYVSEDRRVAFDLYDAPTPEAIRKTSARNNLPVVRITEVRVLDPFSYRGGRP